MSRNKNKPASRLYAGNQRGHSLTHTAFCFITNNSVADFFTHGKTDFDFALSALGINQNHAPPPDRFPDTIGSAELLISFERIATLHFQFSDYHAYADRFVFAEEALNTHQNTDFSKNS